MANYTNQFRRRDPLAFDPGFGFLGRLRTAVEDSRRLLATRSRLELEAIAHEVAAIVDETEGELMAKLLVDYGHLPKQVSPFEVPPGFEGFKGSERFGGFLPVGVSSRVEDGEVGIFQLAAPSRCRQDATHGKVGFERHEAFAVIALWLAIDCVDELKGISTLSERERAIQTPEIDARIETLVPGAVFQPGSPMSHQSRAQLLVIDAARASLLALEAQERLAELEAVRQAGALPEVLAAFQARQAAAAAGALKANKARWAHLIDLRSKALEIANSKPFTSRASAVRAVLDELAYITEREYTFETVDGWLKRMGWQPPELGASTSK